jgi:hypothetical protein
VVAAEACGGMAYKPSEAGSLDYVVRGSHRRLVPPLPTNPGEPAEAQSGRGLVVVPVARPEPTLETAAAIALDLGWDLLLLCSRGNQARRAQGLVARASPGLPLTAADVLHRDLLRAPREWRTGQHAAARERLDIDTNRKRNLGLAAARMTGCSWVLFVDDDVLHLSSSHICDAVGHLFMTRRGITSWACEFFPDNSVVHHARRDFLGLSQDVFLCGAALLVRMDSWEAPGFPPIYNEDWLFLFDPIARGQVVAGPDIGQLSFDPYDHPERARDQEFGDVLGEGLYHLLHEKLRVDVAFHPDYWRSVHAKRTKLIQMIIAELRRRLALVATEAEHTRLTHALAAILESRHQLTRATPESLADFVRRWRHDEELWREFLGRLPHRETLKEALVYLGLHESWIVTS